MTSRWRQALVLLRVLAAVLGGYVLASVAAMAVAFIMPWCCGWSRAEGVLAGSLLSFAFYLAVVIWVFSARMGSVLALTACSVVLAALLAAMG
jgi:hypothetical protein